MTTNVNDRLGMMTDKELLQDFMMSQKHMTTSYNIYTGECANVQLRDTMLNILKEEHCIQADLFNDMVSNGWYQTSPADADSAAPFAWRRKRRCAAGRDWCECLLTLSMSHRCWRLGRS